MKTIYGFISFSICFLLFISFPMYVWAEDTGDLLVPVQSVSASSYQPQDPPQRMIDGNIYTIYHSSWNNESNLDSYFPITLTFDFTEADRIDYMVYYPRQDGSLNGLFKEVQLAVKCEGDAEYTALGTYDFEGRSGISVVSFGKEGVLHPRSIRMTILSGEGEGQGFASCGEMQFFKTRLYPEIEKVFADPACTELQKKISDKNLSEKEIGKLPFPELQAMARELRDGSYDTRFRVAEYAPFYSPEELEKKLGLRKGYTRNQLVTGILIQPGRQLVMVEGIPVMDENSAGPGAITLNVVKWFDPKNQGQSTRTYLLHNGLNVLTHEDSWSGLAYLNYSGKKPEKMPLVKVHFVSGVVNGYFDAARHTNEEWDHLLENATYPIIDAVGTYIQLAYPVADFKRYSSSRGVELLQAYDRQMEAQYDLMGYTKYRTNQYVNRIQGRISYHPGYYMFRDAIGVGFVPVTMKEVANVDQMTQRDTWGVSHELGHVHQLNPYFNWAGMGEVSNNVYSMYMQTQVFRYPSRLSVEGRYENARRNLLENGLEGQVAWSRKAVGRSDSIFTKGTVVSYLEVDVFQRLVPFWKLYLYFKKKGNTDFYPDLYEALRRTSEEEEVPLWLLGRTWRQVERNGRTNTVPCQLNFVKKASQIGGVNLYPFFERYGFFVTGQLKFIDYGLNTYELTEKQLDLFKADLYGLGLPELTPSELEKMLLIEETD